MDEVKDSPIVFLNGNRPSNDGDGNGNGGTKVSNATSMRNGSMRQRIEDMSEDVLISKRLLNPNFDAEEAVKNWIDDLTGDTFPVKFVLELSHAQLICRSRNVMVLELIINLRSERELFLQPEQFRQNILEYYQDKMNRRYNRDLAIQRNKLEVLI